MVHIQFEILLTELARLSHGADAAPSTRGDAPSGSYLHSYPMRTTPDIRRRLQSVTMVNRTTMCLAVQMSTGHDGQVASSESHFAPFIGAYMLGYPQDSSDAAPLRRSGVRAKSLTVRFSSCILRRFEERAPAASSLRHRSHSPRSGGGGVAVESRCQRGDERSQAGAGLQVKFYEDPSDQNNCVLALMALVNSLDRVAAAAGVAFTDTIIAMSANGHPMGQRYQASTGAPPSFRPPARFFFLEDDTGDYRLYFTELPHPGTGRSLEIRLLFISIPGTLESFCVLECVKRHGRVV